MKKVLVAFGTRPEAIKLAPVIKELQKLQDITPVCCVTAQHRQMLDQVLSLFQLHPGHDLDIMREDQSLTDVTSRVLTGLTEVLEAERPDIVLVQGDTTTAMASALAAYYQRIPVGHVEAGLRTGDKYNPFPEEGNRVIADHLSDLCFAPTELAKENLLREGVDASNIHVTGNTVVDALLDAVQRLTGDQAQVQQQVFLLQSLPPWLRDYHWSGQGKRRLILVTGHRRESFGKDMESICYALRQIAQRNEDVEVVYPVHMNPNVREPVYRIVGDVDRVHLLEPLGYAPFVWLMSQSHLILTDSGGIQEEAPSLGKPTLVMRKTTERPEGIEAGTALLVGVDTDSIVVAAQRLLDDKEAYQRMATAKNPYGDGHAAERIAEILVHWFEDHAL